MTKIKILFQSRLDLFSQPGGDTVQMLETKKALEELGIVIEINNSLNKNLTEYDLVHIFNLDWVCETYPQIKNAKKQNKPVILSPIHHSLKEFEKYEKEYRFGLAKVGNFLFPSQPIRDVARNITKGVFYPPKIIPALLQLKMGIRKQQKLSLELSDHVIVQTNKEAKDLIESYKTDSFKWTKVVNGVNIEKFQIKNIKKAKDFIPKGHYIYSVGRIEPRKNQLSLIKAFKELKTEDSRFKNFSLIFSGSKNKHHPTYINQFNKLTNSSSDIFHTGFVEQEVLTGLYSSSTIFAVPSWFETTGLVYLEAVVSGAKSILATGDRAKEYLKDNANYCDPSSIQSIKSELINCLKPTVSGNFANEVKNKYNWKNTAEQTIQVYEKVLNK